MSSTAKLVEVRPWSAQQSGTEVGGYKRITVVNPSKSRLMVTLDGTGQEIGPLAFKSFRIDQNKMTSVRFKSDDGNAKGYYVLHDLFRAWSLMESKQRHDFKENTVKHVAVINSPKSAFHVELITRGRVVGHPGPGQQPKIHELEDSTLREVFLRPQHRPSPAGQNATGWFCYSL